MIATRTPAPTAATSASTDTERRRGVHTERWGWQPLAWQQGGLPTWRWGFAPAGLLTRRQMRAEGLAPGGALPVAQVVFWCRRAGREVLALLWLREELTAKRVPTAAQRRALQRAMAARRRCPSCARDVGYCIPTSIGTCVSCAWPELDGPELDKPAASDSSMSAAARSASFTPISSVPALVPGGTR